MSGTSGGEMSSQLAVVSRSRETPPVSAPAFLEGRSTPRVQWTSPDGVTLVGAGAAAELTADGQHRFDSIRADGEAVLTSIDFDGPPIARPRFVGGFSFTDTHTPTAPWTGFPAAAFVLPHTQVVSDGTTTWVTVTHAGDGIDPDDLITDLDALTAALEEEPAMRPLADPPGVVGTDSTPDRSTWREDVTTVLEHIRGGDLEKVVLARVLRAELGGAFDGPSLVERLRHRYPDCYRFLLDLTGDAAFVGAPPERLVRVRDRDVTTEALAGSAERGATPEADAEAAARLRDSQKLQAEQGLVVDAIVEQLSRFGTVTTGDQGIRRLSNIQHLQTPITASLDADHHVLDIVEALHPTPAVGGVPPATALATIQETETFDRGWYAAPVGWFDGNGDGEFTVAIRSAVGADNSATLYAGNGIVADSDPDEEWAELQPKYRPILEELE
ncbi:MAG: isochorismate synthase MenF [Halobacteriaceae archaeon]